MIDFRNSFNTKKVEKSIEDNKGNYQGSGFLDSDIAEASEINSYAEAWINFISTGQGSRYLALPDVRACSAFKTCTYTGDIIIPANASCSIVFMPTNDTGNLYLVNTTAGTMTLLYRMVNDISNTYENFRVNAYRMFAKILLPSSISNLVESEMNVAVVPVFTDILAIMDNIGAIQYGNTVNRILDSGCCFTVAGRGVEGTPLVPTSGLVDYNVITLGALFTANVTRTIIYVPPASYLAVKPYGSFTNGTMSFQYLDTAGSVRYTTTINLVTTQLIYWFQVDSPINAIRTNTTVTCEIAIETCDPKEEAVIAKLSASDLNRTMRITTNIFIQGTVKSTLMTDIPLDSPPKREYIEPIESKMRRHLRLYTPMDRFQAAGVWDTIKEVYSYLKPALIRLLRYSADSMEAGTFLAPSKMLAADPIRTSEVKKIRKNRCIFCRDMSNPMVSAVYRFCKDKLEPCSSGCVVINTNLIEMELRSPDKYLACPPTETKKDKEDVQYSSVAYSNIPGYPVLTSNPALEAHPVTGDPVEKYLGNDICYTTLRIRSGCPYIYITIDSIAHDHNLNRSIMLRDKYQAAEPSDDEKLGDYVVGVSTSIQTIIKRIPIEYPTDQMFQGTPFKPFLGVNNGDPFLNRLGHNWKYNFFPLINQKKPAIVSWVAVATMRNFNRALEESDSAKSVQLYEVCSMTTTGTTPIKASCNINDETLMDNVFAVIQQASTYGYTTSEDLVILFGDENFQGGSFGMALLALLLGLPSGKFISGVIGFESDGSTPKPVPYDCASTGDRVIVSVKSTLVSPSLPLFILTKGYFTNDNSTTYKRDKELLAASSGAISAHKLARDQGYVYPVDNMLDMLLLLSIDTGTFIEKPNNRTRLLSALNLTNKPELILASWAAVFSGNIDNINFIRCQMIMNKAFDRVVDTDPSKDGKEANKGLNTKIRYTVDNTTGKNRSASSALVNSIYTKNKGNSQQNVKKPPEDETLLPEDRANSGKMYAGYIYPKNFNRTNLIKTYQSIKYWLEYTVAERKLIVTHIIAMHLNNKNNSNAVLPIMFVEPVQLGNATYYIACPKITNKVQMLKNARSYLGSKSSVSATLTEEVRKFITKDRIVFLNESMAAYFYDVTKTLDLKPPTNKVKDFYALKYNSIVFSNQSPLAPSATFFKLTGVFNSEADFETYLKEPFVNLARAKVSSLAIDEPQRQPRNDTRSTRVNRVNVNNPPSNMAPTKSSYQALLQGIHKTVVSKISESGMVSTEWLSDSTNSDRFFSLLEKKAQDLGVKMPVLIHGLWIELDKYSKSTDPADVVILGDLLLDLEFNYCMEGDSGMKEEYFDLLKRNPSQQRVAADKRANAEVTTPQEEEEYDDGDDAEKFEF